MESTQRDISSILVQRLLELELVSERTCQNVLNSLHSSVDLCPDSGYTVCLTKEGKPHGNTKNTS